MHNYRRFIDSIALQSGKRYQQGRSSDNRALCNQAARPPSEGGVMRERSSYIMTIIVRRLFWNSVVRGSAAVRWVALNNRQGVAPWTVAASSGGGPSIPNPR